MPVSRKTAATCLAVAMGLKIWLFGFGASALSLDANSIIWEFFARHPLRTPPVRP
jgi:hypothetical protein